MKLTNAQKKIVELMSDGYVLLTSDGSKCCLSKRDKTDIEVNKKTAGSLADQGVIKTVKDAGFYFTWTLTEVQK